MSNFVGLNTALSGLRASQMGLDTASHNVANANTNGYTRQRVELRSSLPFASPVGPLGTGVTVTGIGRLRDGFLDARVRTTLGAFAFADVRTQLLGRTEAVLAEPDNGFASALGVLWSAFEDLALDPSGTGPRQQVVGALESLASSVRSTVTGWDQLATDSRQRLETEVTEANQLLDRVARLNRLIPQNAGTNGQLPSDLMDERDKIVDRLAELIGATASTTADGDVTVAAGGVELVSGYSARHLATQPDGRVGLAPPGDPNPLPLSGQVGATSAFLADELPATRAAFDVVVDALVTQLNDQHAGKPLPGGGTSGDLLVRDATGALRVAADVVADPRRIAAGLTDAPHDASNAVALAALRRTPFDGTRTVEEAYAGFVTGVANRVATGKREADGQHSLAMAAQSARYGMHGVSLDEEMADVVRFQRSLEAMSRVMNAIDEALNVLVNRTGIVGR